MAVLLPRIADVAISEVDATILGQMLRLCSQLAKHWVSFRAQCGLWQCCKA